MGVLILLIRFYMFVIFISVIASWLPIPKDNTLLKSLNGVVEPALAPIRKVMPDTGGLDFSPIILLLGLSFIARLLGG